MKIIKQNKINKNIYEDMHVDGNLALKLEEKIEYETPKVKKLIIKQSPQKIFMGCWQGCNELSEGDGC